MRKIILLIFSFLMASNLFAEAIDEYKSDIYFANGVGAIERKISFEQGRFHVKIYLATNSQMQKFIGKYDLAFNIGRGLVNDFFEAWLQYVSENLGAKISWEAFKTIFSKVTGSIGKGVLKVTEETAKRLELEDITKQVEQYRQSIYNGHRVIVIAHSQGNFFTNKAYKTFDTDKDRWMQDFFVTIGLASPSDVKIKNSSYLTYDNDPIVVLGGAGMLVANPMRYYTWYAGSNVPVDSTTTSPCTGTEASVGDTPYCSEAGWIAHDSQYEKYHEFDYYMTTSLTRDKVYSFITNAIERHKIFQSQWKFIKPPQCEVLGCKNKLREVEHIYDSRLNFMMQGALVYPFEETGKLYSVVGHGFVKASYGGIGIDEPTDKKICYALKDEIGNTIDTIVACSTCQDASMFEVISHQNIGTKEWRVTVKNKETQESVEGVYPFNLTGSLYHLDSGEWVIASCGGTAIESSWSGQQDYEIYRLVGTGEIINVYDLIIKLAIEGTQVIEKHSPEDFAIGYWDDVDPGSYPGMTFLKFSESFKNKFEGLIDEFGLSNNDIAPEEYRISEIGFQGSTPNIYLGWVYSPNSGACHAAIDRYYSSYGYLLEPKVVVAETSVFGMTNSGYMDKVYTFNNDPQFNHITFDDFRCSNSVYPNFSIKPVAELDYSMHINRPIDMPDYAFRSGYKVISQETKTTKIFLNSISYHGNFLASNGWTVNPKHSYTYVNITYIEYRLMRNK